LVGFVCSVPNAAELTSSRLQADTRESKQFSSIHQSLMCQIVATSRISSEEIGIMLTKRQCHHPAVDSYVPNLPSLYINLSEDQLENVVEDVIASGSIRHKLECLAVVHRSLLLIDLEDLNQRSACQLYTSTSSLKSIWYWWRTKSAPVTRIRIPACSPEGWASRVLTWCLTLMNGSPCSRVHLVDIRIRKDRHLPRASQQ